MSHYFNRVKCADREDNLSLILNNLTVLTMYKLTFAICFTFFLGSHANLIKVSTPLGDLIGKVNDENVASFLGIPFAYPPVNELRFQLPKSPLKWKGELNATKYADACHQVMAFAQLPRGLEQSEDCLYLNIHVDQGRVNASDKLPVVIFIHGGGFIIGSSVENDYDNLVTNRNIIGVSIQYRLGVLGFAKSPDDLAIPGNLGLHDQVAAIKWVKKYISYFGGNPDSITLHGQSVGSTSVAFHMFSPLTKNTFSQAIMQSGCPQTMGLKSNETIDKLMSELLELVNCKEAVESFECLRTAAITSLLDAQKNFTSRGIAFMPTHDSRYFAGKNPVDWLKAGNFTTKVESLLIGHTGSERGEHLSFMAPDLFPGTQLPFVKHLWKWQMKRAVASTPKEHRGVINESLMYKLIDRTYEDRWVLSPVEVANKLVRMWSDSTVGCPQMVFSEAVLKANPETKLFYFLFSARPVVKKQTFLPYLKEAVHGEELQFVFGKPLNDRSNYTQDEVDFSNSLMDNWAQFVKSGTVANKNWLTSKLEDGKVLFNHMAYVTSTESKFKSGFTTSLCDSL